MKPLKFKDAEHQSWASCDGVAERYKIDWARNEEKYKNVCKYEVRVYQGGRVSLHTNGFRQPCVRTTLLNVCGIDLRTTKEIRGVKFFAPDGTPVVKGNIQSSILLLDHEHKIALTGNNIHWVDTGYAPKSTMQIACRVRSKENEIVFRKQWSEVLDLAVTMYSFEKDFRDNTYNARGDVLQWIKNPRPQDAVTDALRLKRLGCFQMEAKNDFNEFISEKCEIVSRFDYLKFKEV